MSNIPILGGAAHMLGQDATSRPIEGPEIRLLHCATCNSIEELPDYEGDPRGDTLLEISVQRHRFPSGEEHIGKLLKVPVAAWAMPEARKQIIDRIKGGEAAKGLAEIDKDYYDTRSTFAEDALVCYKAHLSPKNGCPEYGAAHKALRPDTSAERKELGLAPVATGPTTFLCNFCPVQVHVHTIQRQKAGLYK